MTTHILCAVNGSDDSNRALTAAVGLAKKLDVKLSICFVNVFFGTSPRGHQAHTYTDAEAAKILADAVAMVKVLRHELSSAEVLLDREASTAIIHHAIALGADHIVIGTGDKRGLERLVLGSVAKDIATRAACTVTIVR